MEGVFLGVTMAMPGQPMVVAQEEALSWTWLLLGQEVVFLLTMMRKMLTPEVPPV